MRTADDTGRHRRGSDTAGFEHVALFYDDDAHFVARVVDHVRHARSRPGTPTAPADLSLLAGHGGTSGSGDFSNDLVTAWFLEEALTRLGDDQRSAIVETSVRGRPYAEVAAEQGVPVGTLRSRVFYGLRNLRQILDDTGVPL